MNIGDRIKDLRKKRKMTLEEVANVVGVSKSTILKWETGSIKSMRQNKIILLAQALGVNPVYLMGWADDDLGITVEYLKDIGEVQGIPQTEKLPRLGEIACGEPILAVENIETYDDVPVSAHATFTVVAKGDSMTGAKIDNGDIVYIRQQSDVDNGEIAAILINDEVTLKRVFKSSSTLVLQAENPAYAPIILTEQSGDIRILGKAVGVYSPIR